MSSLFMSPYLCNIFISKREAKYLYQVLTQKWVRYLICISHSLRSRAVKNRIFFFFPEDTYFPSWVRNMFWVTISYNDISTMIVNNIWQGYFICHDCRVLADSDYSLSISLFLFDSLSVSLSVPSFSIARS